MARRTPKPITEEKVLAFAQHAISGLMSKVKAWKHPNAEWMLCLALSQFCGYLAGVTMMRGGDPDMMAARTSENWRAGFVKALHEDDAEETDRLMHEFARASGIETHDARMVCDEVSNR